MVFLGPICVPTRSKMSGSETVGGGITHLLRRMGHEDITQLRVKPGYRYP